MIQRLTILVVSLLILIPSVARTVDVCIYGATSAGITAAITAQREGKSYVLITPTEHIGGLSTGGLGLTDIGKVSIIQGLSFDFYRRLGHYYGTDGATFTFEPKAASAVFAEMMNESGVKPVGPYRIASVKKRDGRITSATFEHATNGRRLTVKARYFIDCTYEGDLMARCGVSYSVGREGNAVYGESNNGVQMQWNHQMPDGVDPYVVKGDPTSGLLYGISPEPMGEQGSGDALVQAYNFRLTLTDDSTNMVPITRPADYDSSRYELLVRIRDVYKWSSLNEIFIWSHLPGHKTDINNRGGFSTDMIGANWNYPEGSWDERQTIYDAHRSYTLGLLYFVGHDKRVPETVRREMLRWGWPKDEYIDNNHLSPQLYIRESRRMKGCYVMTEHNLMQRAFVSDTIAWAAYTMDSHNCSRRVVNGMVKNEGNVEIPVRQPYAISYRSITPQREDATNLLVPVCLSASHIAYGSIRMEPVFMVLGETSALAVCQALERKVAVQDVDAHRVMHRFSRIHKDEDRKVDTGGRTDLVL